MTREYKSKSDAFHAGSGASSGQLPFFPEAEEDTKFFQEDPQSSIRQKNSPVAIGLV
jgi:hypothetical protein